MGRATPREPVIGVIGAGEGATPADCLLAEELGGAIARRGWALLTGGRPEGVMDAACAGAMAVEGHLVVGVLLDDGERRGDAGATAPLDVALYTGMGQGRNVINVLSSEVVVVCGSGGPGTAAEAAHALKAGRPLVLLATPSAWLALFGSLGGQVMSCATVAQAMDAMEGLLGAWGSVAAAEDSAKPDAPQQGEGLAGAAPQGEAAAKPKASSPIAEEGPPPGSAAPAPNQTLPVALVQLAAGEDLSAGEDLGANLRQAEAWLERALQPPPGHPKPRLLMLPEIWNAPYASDRFAAYAESIPELGKLWATRGRRLPMSLFCSD